MNTKRKDVRGQKFWMLTAERRVRTAKDGSTIWRWRCECGKTRDAVAAQVKSGRIRSCGCRKREGSWSTSEEIVLRKMYPTTSNREIAELLGRAEQAVHSRATRLGLLKAVGHGRRIPWTREQRAELKRRYPNEPTDRLAKEWGRSLTTVYQQARLLGLVKSPEYLAGPFACRLRRGDNVGAAFRFKKGGVPFNKGLRRPGWFRGRMRETQFKKGQSPGNTMPLWTFRWVYMNSNGKGQTRYMMLKTGKPGPKPHNGWEWVHKMIWENAHGPIRPGHRIWWKDGDHANNSLLNLELLSDAEHMRRTTIHNLPAPLPQLYQLTGALKRKIKNREGKLTWQRTR
jgi:HNH endonuclease